MRRRIWGAVAGLAAGGAGIGASEATAAVLPGVTSPVLAVANRIIDWTPRQLKELAIEQFGTKDKPILLASVIGGMVLGLAVAGFLGARKPSRGLALFGLLSVVATVLVLADRASTAGPVVRLVPVVVLAVVSLGLLWWLLGRVTAAEATAPKGFDRRSFLLAAGAATAVAAAGTISGQTFLKPGTGRSGVRIPNPTYPAMPVPSGTELGMDGLTSYITSNREFYRVDTALSVPRVPVSGYKLRIHGMVDKPVELSFKELLDMPLVERRITLTCVSQPVGGPYVGNATWIGVRTKDLLEQLGVQDGADAVKSTSVDGMTIGTPIEALMDDRDSMLAIAMNGEPLPLEHGFPVRMVVPGLYGYVSATKWLNEIEVTRFADFKAYWTSRGYSEQAPIKTGSRIDVPRSFAKVRAGKTPVAGVAWAQRTRHRQGRGARRRRRVERSRSSQPPTASTPGASGCGSGTPSRATTASRCARSTATARPSRGARAIAPDGATGWPSVQVTVA